MMHKTREEAWKIFEKEVVYHPTTNPSGYNDGHIIRMGYNRGFRDGAASVDRVEVVREAFEELKVEIKSGEWVETLRAMDAVLEAMEKGKMKVNLDKEWLLRRAEQEEGVEVLASDRPPPPAEPKCECPEPSPYGHTCPPTTETASECKCGLTDPNPNYPQWHANDCPAYRSAPPASIEDRAKAFWYERHKNALDGDFFVAGYASDMASFAQAEISRQRPEIERAAVEKAFDELEGEIQDVMGAWGGPERKVVDGMMTELFTRMQAVKTRGEQG